MSTENGKGGGSKNPSAGKGGSKGKATAPAASKPTDAAAQAGSGGGAEAGDGKGGKGETYMQRMSKLGPVQRAKVKAKNALDRARRLMAFVEGWPNDVPGFATDVVSTLDAFVKALETVPADYKPARTSMPSSRAIKLEVGTKVRLTLKAVDKYKDVLEEHEHSGLEITKVVGKKLVCKTKGGDKLVIPRGHVRRDDEEAPAQAQEASAPAAS